MSVHYMIRRKTDGLFSNGGSSPRFTKTGKVWRTRSGLSNHFSLVRPGSYGDCEVVTLKTIETAVEPVSGYLEAAAKRKADREAEYRTRAAKRRETHERAEARKLIAKYGRNP